MPVRPIRPTVYCGSLFNFAGKAHAVPIGFNPCRGIEHFPEQGRERYLATPELVRMGEAIREPRQSGDIA